MIILIRKDIRKHVSEQSCSSVRVFLSILAHLAHLAFMFCLFLNEKEKMKDHRPNNKEQNADLEFLS